MSVRIKLSLLLQKYVPNYNEDVGIVVANAQGKTIRELIVELGIPPEQVFTVLVNHLPAQPNRVVKDGDTVTLARVLGAG